MTIRGTLGLLMGSIDGEDVYVTAGCTQAIETTMSILAKPHCNILLPRPGYPTYALCASLENVEVRYYDLVPQNNWQVNLEDIEHLADQNTIAIVIINPGNPCGSVYSIVYSYDHLKKIAETAKRVKTLVVADEVYGHLAFGENPFTPMGLFSSITPVLTLGSLSKRWLIPGWRLGWFVINDPNCAFKSPKIIERINKYSDIYGGPATFIQAAVPKIIESTKEDFFMNTLKMLKKNLDICYERIMEIPCINCPYKSQGSMFVMVKLNTTLLQDVSDDMDFCYKLAKEESVILLPDDERKKEVILLGIGDPTAHSCFQTTNAAKDAVVESLLLDKFNGYSPIPGLPTTRK
ncbi:hypothetical protein HAX54_006945 [Datura stramonium]|uniref:Aminotransferase class I/classII large domain-containing protein n=1 Tax=Datura stramonium TaxID=4076 RepID=A0ABS8TC61_DATST|nr:hypothetical protein [Datura stramonium]